MKKKIKSTSINPIKIELQNNSKLQHQNNILNLNLHRSLKHKNILNKKSNRNLIESASTLINKSQKYINNNVFSSINSTNTESNILKLNNSNSIKKNNSFSQQLNSVYSVATLNYPKSLQVQKEIQLKIPKKNKILPLKKFNKFNTEGNQPDKEHLRLPCSVNKSNPIHLLEISLRQMDKNMNFFEKDGKIFFNSTNNRMNTALIGLNKNKEKKIFKIKKINNNNKEKKILNRKDKFMYLFKKKNNINKINNVVNKDFTKQKIHQCIAINNSCYNPILQYLDNSNYTKPNIFDRCQTENIDDIKNNSSSMIKSNVLKLNNYPLIKVQENTAKNFSYNKIYLEELKSEYEMNKIGKRQFADASCDTNLDKAYNNKLKKNIIKNVNPKLNDTNIDSNMFNKFKAFIPKNRLYKNSKFFKKSKKSFKNEEKKGNTNLSDVKFYNFKEVVDLFGKKINLSKKPKIAGYFNKFRNKSCKYYSSTNNLEITLLRKFNLKNSNRPKLLSNNKEQITKDSNMDFYEDIEDSITKKI